MEPINEQCFSFAIFILCYQKTAGDKAKCFWTRDWLRHRPQSSAYATLLRELDRNEYKKNLRRFVRISRQMSMCGC